MPQALSLQPGPRPPVPPGPFPRGPGKRQGGAALMVLLIILVVATSAVILAKIDPTRHELVRETQTSEALARAGELLMAWAVAHPAQSSGAPGVLPFPDRDTGAGFDGIGNCVPNGINESHLIGRFPWGGEGLAGCETAPIGKDIRDGWGAPLYYAVSRNIVSHPGAGAAPVNSNLPDLDPPPFPWLQVRDADGNVISDRVAAVIIAPGPALAGQDRSGAAPTIANFLETFDLGGDTVGNTLNDGCPDVAAGCADSLGEDFYIHQSEEFNDRLIFITIDELMPRVERRAALEAARILRQFKLDHGRYPWLAPFANPLVRAPVISGRASSGTGGTTLIDNDKDFGAANVVDTGSDLLWNLTSGASGTVSAVVNATEIASTNLDGGSRATFSESDDYHIAATGLNHTGFAGGGNNVTDALQDINAHFWSVLRPGALVRNVTDGSAAMVGAVPVTGAISDTLSFAALAGGTDDDFDTGDDYRVEMDHGTATGGTATSLVDTGADFELLDVRAGTPVLNLTEGSAAWVTGVTSTDLTLSGLRGGVDNTFDAGDAYRLGRFDGRVDTRFGQLPVHVLGGPFRSGFQVAWTLRDGSYGFSDPLPSPDPLVHSESMKVASRDTVVAAGTASAGSGGLILEDTATDFFDDGVALGDAVIVDHGAYGTITAMTATTLTLDGLTGVAPLAFAGGDGYTVHRVHRVGDGVCVWDRRAVVRCMGRTPRTPLITGIATGGGPATLEDLSEVFSAVGDSPADPTDDVTRWRVKGLDKVVRLEGTFATGGFAILEDTTANFVAAGIVMGDTVTNVTDGSSGLVTAPPTATTLEVALSGGMDNAFEAGDQYGLPLGGGTATGGVAILEDTTANFVAAGIVMGDNVINVTDGSSGLVTAPPTTTTLEVALSGGMDNAFEPGDQYALPPNANAGVITGIFPHTLDIVGLAHGFAAGNAYRILLATNSTSPLGLAPAGAGTTNTLLEAAPGDSLPMDLEEGDVVRKVGSPSEYGFITDVSGLPTEVGVRMLDGGTLAPGDSYEIRYHLVAERAYEFRLAFAGAAAVPGSDPAALGLGYADAKTRDVLLLNANHVTPPGATGLRIRVLDYQADGTLLGDVSLAANDNITATVLARGIHMDLEQGVELPDWFMDNEWYRFLYAAAAVDEMPSGGGLCEANPPCLTIQDLTGLELQARVEAVVIASGASVGSGDRLFGGTCGPGSVSPFECHYLDPPPDGAIPVTPNNSNETDILVRDNVSATFNDVLTPVCLNLTTNDAGCLLPHCVYEPGDPNNCEVLP